MMKKVFFVWTIAAAAALLSAGAVAAAEQAGPKIEVKQEHYDFGKVAQGEQAVHLFEIRNAGNGVLDIQKVQTS